MFYGNIFYAKSFLATVTGPLPEMTLPGMLHFATFCQIFEKLRLKTILNPEIPPDCYFFDIFL